MADDQEKPRSEIQEEEKESKWKHGIILLADEHFTKFKVIDTVTYKEIDYTTNEILVPLLIDRYNDQLKSDKLKHDMIMSVIEGLINGKVNIKGREISIPDLFAQVNIEVYKQMVIQAQMEQNAKTRIIKPN